MKKCINCGKESDGNFCVFCGGKLIKEKAQENLKKITDINIEEKEPQLKQEINIKSKKIKTKNKSFMYVSIILSIIIIALIIYIICDKNKVNDEISSLETQISRLKKEKSDLKDENSDYFIENIKYKSKVDFLDENIVFVLDGYGNYYYTYDQVQQVTQGKEYSYWAYNKEAAISKGYRAWK